MHARLAALALLSAFMALPVHARTADHYAKACGLEGTPSSVVVDVYDDAAPGSILATIPNGDVEQIGSLDCYQTNLATTGAAIAYPDSDDPVPKHYTLVFRDDGANSVELTETVFGVVGIEAYQACALETPVYATTPVPSRGITSSVIAQGKPSYFKVEIDCTRAFTSPPVTFYWTFKYDSKGRVESKTPSATPPSP